MFHVAGKMGMASPAGAACQHSPAGCGCLLSPLKPGMPACGHPQHLHHLPSQKTCLFPLPPGARCVPFPSVLQGGKQFKPPAELSQVFQVGGECWYGCRGAWLGCWEVEPLAFARDIIIGQDHPPPFYCTPQEAGVDVSQPLVGSCGSGLTASILALAVHQITGRVVSTGATALLAAGRSLCVRGMSLLPASVCTRVESLGAAHS